jgi:Pyruvate/2-oxoacid:ferredoxin oxidoreductase gamma subunit
VKTKFRFAGRGGQGIKFAGSILARVAMTAGYHTTVTVDYTPSVRGGPIFCDVVIGSRTIDYPFCDRDADVLVMLDQKGCRRAAECVCRKTASFVDDHTVQAPETFICEGTLYRCPFSKLADGHDLAAVVNILALGWLSKYMHARADTDRMPRLGAERYQQLFESLPKRFRDINRRAFQLGREHFTTAAVARV